MKTRAVLLIFSLFLFSTCDLFESDQNLTIEVMNLDNWTPENPFPNAYSGVTVKLFESLSSDEEVPIDEATTDEDGIVRFSVSEGDYWVRIEHAGASNLLQKELVNGLTIGLIIDDYFHSQAEVDSRGTPGGYVGGPILKDYNGDELFNIEDKLPGNKVSAGEVRRVFIMTE